MEAKIQQWCQNDTQAITDLGFLAPSAFGFRSATIPCKKCACSTCDALAVLEETCKTLIISKQQLARAEKEHAEAKNEHAEAENRMTPNDRSAKKDRELELLGKILADKAELVASHLNLISKDANLVYRDANLIIGDANTIYLAHRVVSCLLGALGASEMVLPILIWPNVPMTFQMRESISTSDPARLCLAR